MKNSNSSACSNEVLIKLVADYVDIVGVSRDNGVCPPLETLLAIANADPQVISPEVARDIKLTDEQLLQLTIVS